MGRRTRRYLSKMLAKRSQPPDLQTKSFASSREMRGERSTFWQMHRVPGPRRFVIGLQRSSEAYNYLTKAVLTLTIVQYLTNARGTRSLLQRSRETCRAWSSRRRWRLGRAEPT